MSPTPAVTPAALREAIAGALHVVKAYELAAACEYLGLEPQKPDEDPFNSKRIYVRSRLQRKTLSELVDIARRVINEYGDDDLQALVRALGARGVDGDVKNLIFAADGPKPRIVLPDGNLGNGYAMATEVLTDFKVWSVPIQSRFNNGSRRAVQGFLGYGRAQFLQAFLVFKHAQVRSHCLDRERSNLILQVAITGDTGK